MIRMREKCTSSRSRENSGLFFLNKERMCVWACMISQGSKYIRTESDAKGVFFGKPSGQLRIRIFSTIKRQSGPQVFILKGPIITRCNYSFCLKNGENNGIDRNLNYNDLN